jgi:SPW repeat-containing protein
MGTWTSAKLCDVGNLIVGGFLLFTPWMFAFPPGIQSDNAVVCGVLIMLLSLAALIGFAAWEEWGNMTVGLWLMASPWIVGLHETQAVRVQFTIGIIVAAFAKNELWFRAHLKRTDGIT